MVRVIPLLSSSIVFRSRSLINPLGKGFCALGIFSRLVSPFPKQLLIVKVKHEFKPKIKFTCFVNCLCDSLVPFVALMLCQVSANQRILNVSVSKHLRNMKQIFCFSTLHCYLKVSKVP
jgi:hypothetical protein